MTASKPLKEATAAAAPRSKTADMPHDNAERVVTGARNLSPFLGGRMMSTRLLGKGVFIREVLPRAMKLEIAHLSRKEAMSVSEFWHMSWVMGTRGSWTAPVASSG